MTSRETPRPPSVCDRHDGHFLLILGTFCGGHQRRQDVSTTITGRLYWALLMCSSTSFGVTQMTCWPFQYFTMLSVCSVLMMSVCVILVIRLEAAHTTFSSKIIQITARLLVLWPIISLVIISITFAESVVLNTRTSRTQWTSKKVAANQAGLLMECVYSFNVLFSFNTTLL